MACSNNGYFRKLKFFRFLSFFQFLQNGRLAHIFNLNADGFEEILDYLPLKDLVAIGQTCKGLNLAAGKYFQKSFVTSVYGLNGNIYPKIGNVNINCFRNFVQSIIVQDGDLEFLRPTHFPSLKEIELNSGELRNIEYATGVLSHVKTLKFVFCKLNSDVHETIFQHCDNLKHLYVRDTDEVGMQKDVFIGATNNWLRRKYPTLEHFEFISHRKTNEVIEFLKLNPTIRTFSTTIEFLMENMDTISASNKNLTVLSILHSRSEIYVAEFNAFAHQLFELQKRGFFQQLHLYYHRTIIECAYPPNLLQFITALNQMNEPRLCYVSALVNLEQLYLDDISQIGDLDAAIGNLQKLDYIYLYHESVENILTLVKNFPHLRRIKIKVFKNGPHINDDDHLLSLSTLSNVRSNACKLTIFVNENIYLTTKLALNLTTIGLVEIKRHTSFDGSQDFCWE